MMIFKSMSSLSYEYLSLDIRSKGYGWIILLKFDVNITLLVFIACYVHPSAVLMKNLIKWKTFFFF